MFFQAGFPMASTSKALTQKALFPASQFVFMEGNKVFMVNQGLDKGSANPQMCETPSFWKGTFKAKLT